MTMFRKLLNLILAVKEDPIPGKFYCDYCTRNFDTEDALARDRHAHECYFRMINGWGPS